MRHPDIVSEIDSLVQAGKYETAKIICRKHLSSNPEDHDVLYLLGTVHLIAQEFEAGLRPLSRFIEINPNHLNGLINLGNCYLRLKRLFQASDCFNKVLTFDPNNTMALNNLGTICLEWGKHQEAIHYFQQALLRIPSDPEILSNLMISHKAAEKREDAIPLAFQVITMDDAGQALFPAFNLLNSCCYWDEVAEILPRLLQKISQGDSYLNAFEHVNLALLTFPGLKYEKLFDVLKKSGGSIEALREYPPFQHNRKIIASVKRWRIAYLSPDFRNHVVNHFIRGLIDHHDRTRFEVVCYSNTKYEDETTEKYRRAADLFVDVRQMNDLQLAKRIHADGIHFLIDLAGFTGDGRLSVLSYSPAPVQMMYLGYPYTSGLKTVDYFISDPYLDAPENAAYFTETTIKLPESFVSFSPSETGGRPDEIPQIQNRFITFGTLINPYKLNPEVISVWSDILKQLPESKLILNHTEYNFQATRSNITKRLSENGIASNRISFCWSKHPSGNFLQYYNEIDIVLDTFPATGGTTTIDALQMGKPVVTLVGKINPERLSYSILKNIGLELDDLIAFNPKEYIEKAIALAKNPERISTLLHKIPDALKESILCDPYRFTRQMETLYLDAWKAKYDFVPVFEHKAPISEPVSV